MSIERKSIHAGVHVMIVMLLLATCPALERQLSWAGCSDHYNFDSTALLACTHYPAPITTYMISQLIC
eukprot:3915139-Karenia_brevis.AAC.1